MTKRAKSARRGRPRVRANVAGHAARRPPLQNAAQAAIDTETSQQAQPNAMDVETDQAVAAERARCAALRQAFLDDPGFALDAFARGLEVTAAKAEYCDVLRKRLAQRSEP